MWSSGHVCVCTALVCGGHIHTHTFCFSHVLVFIIIVMLCCCCTSTFVDLTCEVAVFLSYCAFLCLIECIVRWWWDICTYILVRNTPSWALVIILTHFWTWRVSAMRSVLTLIGVQRINCIEFKHEYLFGYDRDAGDCINWISPYLACREIGI